MTGSVVFVGAGPGDPELLTLKAYRAIERADVVLYDSLVGTAIIDDLPNETELIPCGKDRFSAKTRQARINELLVERARAGQAVVRLKGGDPTLFGRLGEEIGRLQNHGIPYEVVPGVTAATGASAAIGLSLTHRDLAGGVTLISGHQAPDKQVDPPTWRALVERQHTLVIYMGVARLGRISETLLMHGMAAETPVAIVERATLPDQSLTVDRLDRIVDAANEADVQSPALILVGQIVSLLSGVDRQSAQRRHESDTEPLASLLGVGDAAGSTTGGAP
ncbi:MAG: uroporphyrinogen-III C-methyltransferase [Salinibacter sp.]